MSDPIKIEIFLISGHERFKAGEIFYIPPPPVGYWDLGGRVHFEAIRRPSWLQRRMVRVFFGLKWKDHRS